MCKYIYIYIHHNWGATLLQFANYDFNNEWQQRFFRPLAASMCLAFLADPYDLHTHHHPENLMHILGPNAGKQLNFATKKNQGKFVGKATNLHRLTEPLSPLRPNLEAASPLGVAWHQSPWASWGIHSKSSYKNSLDGHVFSNGYMFLVLSNLRKLISLEL